MTKEEILKKISVILGLKKILTETDIEKTFDLMASLKEEKEKK